jgi:hypothetical protein
MRERRRRRGRKEKSTGDGAGAAPILDRDTGGALQGERGVARRDVAVAVDVAGGGRTLDVGGGDGT